MNDDSIAHAFLNAATCQLEQSAVTIVHCLDQLDERQLWWRPTPSQNSIGNLILHLCGNVRQWIISAVGGTPDARDRPSEFSTREPLPKAELVERLQTCIAEAGRVLSSANHSALLTTCRIQGFDTTRLSGILNSVVHFQGHTQEIISLTRQQLGDKYQFHWTPTTPEQLSRKGD